MSDNPFERWDLDPHEGPAAITERLRELSEDGDEVLRVQLRADWEALTMHPRRRVELALAAHPETRAPLGAAPRKKRKKRDNGGGVADAQFVLADLMSIPTVASALGARIDPRDLPDVSMDEDPILRGRGDEY